MNWYLKVLRDYAKFDGRARRSEYWFFVLFNILFSILATVLDFMLGVLIDFGGDDQAFLIAIVSGYGPVSLLYSLAVLIPSLAVSVRRLHDIGYSGWMFLVALVPCAGPFALLYFFMKDGDIGENGYGPDPKGRSNQIISF